MNAQATKWSGKAAKAGNYALKKLHILFWPIPLLILLEFLNRSSVYQTLAFVYKHPAELILNYIIVLSLFLLFIAMIGRTQIAFWLTTVLISTVGIISGVKFQMLGVPLLPWDVVLTAETADITSHFKDLIPWKLIGGIVAFAVICGLFMNLVKGFKSRFTWKERIVLALLPILLLFGLYSDKPFQIKSAMGIQTIPWDQAENYLWNGYALTTMLNMDLVFIKEPEGYDQQTMAQLAKDVQRRTDASGTVKPNIVVVLAESLFDATKMTNVKFSEDPIPFLHSLQQKYPHGEMLSPQFGGGTANVEFEVLSGNSMRFLPQGSLAYIQYVNHPTDSLAAIMNRQGYHTTAINPFHNWFFNSRNVYYNFGFERFISQEFFEPENTGNYIADKSVAAKIIEEADKSNGPDMIFANTMENHAPYPKHKFGPSQITASGDFSEDSKDQLESYAGGMRAEDNMLKALVEHFQQKGEPTMILFFGDHLPSMGNNYQVYRDTKYITSDDPDFLKKMYSTPYVIWNNFLPENNTRLDVSPSFLSPYMLNMAQLPGTTYTDFLLDLMKKHPIIPPQSYFAQMNIKPEDLKDYELFQYDAMFGEQYTYGDLKTQVAHKDFKLGYDMVIDSVTFEERANEPYIVLKGTNLAPAGTIQVNGQSLATKWENGTLVAPLPKELVGQSKLDVLVTVIDSKKTAIAQTAVKQVDTAVPVVK